MADDLKCIASQLVELIEAAKGKTIPPSEPGFQQQVYTTMKSGRPQPAPPTKLEALANDYLSKLSVDDLREMERMLDIMLGRMTGDENVKEVRANLYRLIDLCGQARQMFAQELDKLRAGNRLTHDVVNGVKTNTTDETIRQFQTWFERLGEILDTLSPHGIPRPFLTWW
jgi:hypothetical protein